MPILGTNGRIGDSRCGDPQEAEFKIIRPLISDQLDVIYDVLDDLSKWSGLELETITHKETPWIEARDGYGPSDICTVTISKESMKAYYKSEIDGSK